MMKHTTLIFVIFFLHAVIGESTEESGESQEVSEDRDKRQFFVTTTTSTTTLTTLKLCWIQFTSVTGSMRCRRKRNIADRIIIDDFENNLEAMISPNPSTAEIDEDTVDDIIDQRQVLDDSELSSSMEDRKAKFLNYWMTISKTMTITSYSTTSTFGSIICTPTSFE